MPVALSLSLSHMKYSHSEHNAPPPSLNQSPLRQETNRTQCEVTELFYTHASFLSNVVTLTWSWFMVVILNCVWRNPWVLRDVVSVPRINFNMNAFFFFSSSSSSSSSSVSPIPSAFFLLQGFGCLTAIPGLRS
jgi:hypothetical protein